MSEETLVRHCSPTLAGIKTGSLFGCCFSSREELVSELRRFNAMLCGKGLRVVSLQYKNGRALIYIYRPAQLSRDLGGELSCELLKSHGYSCGSCERCISELVTRLKNSDEFPHEIGLFLGYPAVDVRGFMRNGDCKCTGLWKVYESDEAEARRQFARCRNCTRAYLHRREEGWSLSRLTIRPAVRAA